MLRCRDVESNVFLDWTFSRRNLSDKFWWIWLVYCNCTTTSFASRNLFFKHSFCWRSFCGSFLWSPFGSSFGAFSVWVNGLAYWHFQQVSDFNSLVRFVTDVFQKTKIKASFLEQRILSCALLSSVLFKWTKSLSIFVIELWNLFVPICNQQINQVLFVHSMQDLVWNTVHILQLIDDVLLVVLFRNLFLRVLRLLNESESTLLWCHRIFYFTLGLNHWCFADSDAWFARSFMFWQLAVHIKWKIIQNLIVKNFKQGPDPLQIL